MKQFAMEEAEEAGRILTTFLSEIAISDPTDGSYSPDWPTSEIAISEPKGSGREGSGRLPDSGRSVSFSDEASGELRFSDWRWLVLRAAGWRR